MEELRPLIEQVFAPKEGEHVIILNDFPDDDLEVDDNYIELRNFARRWHQEFSELGRKIRFKVDEMITYEPTKANNKPLPEKAYSLGKEIELHKLLDSLGEKDIVLAITRYSATAPISEFVRKRKFRGASMPNVSEDMTAFDADYKLVAKKAKILAKKLTEAESCDAEFSTGHNIFFDLRGKVLGLADTGELSSPGEFGNLPAGEAYTCPYEGFDKKLGKSQTQGEIPAYFGEEKCVFIVEENRIVDVSGLGPKAENLRKFFNEDPARRYIAELGLGCNDKAELCGKIIQDEKIEGMHFAYGFNGHFGGEITKEKFKSEDTIVHQDIVYSSQSKIFIRKLELNYPKGKKETIILDGKYVDGLFD